MLKEINQLIIKCKDDDRILKLVSEQLDTLSDYVKIVVNMQYKNAILLESKPNGYQDDVINLDRNRTNAHNAAINACNIINRIAEKNELEQIFNIDTSDRKQVAKVIGDFINELYAYGIGGDNN